MSIRRDSSRWKRKIPPHLTINKKSKSVLNFDDDDIDTPIINDDYKDHDNKLSMSSLKVGNKLTKSKSYSPSRFKRSPSSIKVFSSKRTTKNNFKIKLSSIKIENYTKYINKHCPRLIKKCNCDLCKKKQLDLIQFSKLNQTKSVGISNKDVINNKRKSKRFLRKTIYGKQINFTRTLSLRMRTSSINTPTFSPDNDILGFDIAPTSLVDEPSLNGYNDDNDIEPILNNMQSLGISCECEQTKNNSLIYLIGIGIENNLPHFIHFLNDINSRFIYKQYFDFTNSNLLSQHKSLDKLNEDKEYYNNSSHSTLHVKNNSEPLDDISPSSLFLYDNSVPVITDSNGHPINKYLKKIHEIHQAIRTYHMRLAPPLDFRPKYRFDDSIDEYINTIMVITKIIHQLGHNYGCMPLQVDAWIIPKNVIIESNHNNIHIDNKLDDNDMDDSDDDDLDDDDLDDFSFDDNDMDYNDNNDNNDYNIGIIGNRLNLLNKKNKYNQCIQVSLNDDLSIKSLLRQLKYIKLFQKSTQNGRYVIIIDRGGKHTNINQNNYNNIAKRPIWWQYYYDNKKGNTVKYFDFKLDISNQIEKAYKNKEKQYIYSNIRKLSDKDNNNNNVFTVKYDRTNNTKHILIDHSTNEQSNVRRFDNDDKKQSKLKLKSKTKFITWQYENKKKKWIDFDKKISILLEKEYKNKNHKKQSIKYQKESYKIDFNTKKRINNNILTDISDIRRIDKIKLINYSKVNNNNNNNNISNNDNLDYIYLYQPPKSYGNTIRGQTMIEELHLNTLDYLLPRKDNDNITGIGARNICFGKMFCISFHVMSIDEIRCYLYINGKYMKIPIDNKLIELKNILKCYFKSNNNNKNKNNNYKPAFFTRDTEFDTDFKKWFNQNKLRRSNTNT